MSLKDTILKEIDTSQSETEVVSGQTSTGNVVSGILLSSTILTVIVAYVLWSLLQTGTFLPYTTLGTPNVLNIVIFITLISLMFSCIGTIIAAIGIQLFFIIKKSNRTISVVTLGVVTLTLFFSAEFLLLLHVFRIITWPVTMLSYAVFWSIVGYGKYKERNRFKKYTTESHRTRESKNTVEIRGK